MFALIIALAGFVMMRLLPQPEGNLTGLVLVALLAFGNP